MANVNEQSVQLNENQAKIILQFLQRTQMQGSEMPAYVDVFNTLMSLTGEQGTEVSTAAE